MMMEEIWYYWSLWLLYMLVFFFMEIKHSRNHWLIFILSTLVSGSLSISLLTFQIQMRWLILLLICSFFLYQHKKPLLLMFYSLIVAGYYISLLWWKLLVPIWFVYLSGMEIPLLVALCVIFLMDDLLDSVIILFICFAIGSMVYDSCLIYMQLDNQLGHLFHYIYLQFAILTVLFIYISKKIILFLWIEMRQVR